MVFVIGFFIGIEVFAPMLEEITLLEGFLMGVLLEFPVWFFILLTSTDIDYEEAISFQTFQKNNSHLNINGAIIKYLLKYWFSLLIVLTWGLKWLIENLFYEK